MRMQKILENFKLFLTIIFVSKWVLSRPKKTNILIYDDESIENLNFYLKDKKFEIFYVRYEVINIYVLILSILKNGLINIRENYKLTYFKIVSPKVIITLIDENPGFFKLKSLYKIPKYLSIQIAFKDNHFYDYIDNFLKINKKFNFESDYTFVLGKNDKEKYKKYIKSKIICLGSVKNNNFVKKNLKLSKIKKITYISSIPINRRSLNIKNFRGIKIFNFLRNYCKKKKIRLSLLSKHNISFEKKYRKIYGGKEWCFLPKVSVKDTYQKINESNFIVFDNSTLGYEALSKNIKGVCFPKVFPYKNYSKKFKNDGPFWSCKLTKKIFENKIGKIIKMPEKNWNKIINNFVNRIIFYNPNNNLLKRKLNKILNS